MIEKYFFTTEITFDTVNIFFDNEPQRYDLYYATNGGDGYASIYFAKKLAESKSLRNVICIGEVNSGGNIILAMLNKKKKRYAYNYVSFLMHLVRININLVDLPINYLTNLIKTTKKLNNEIFDIFSQNLKLSDDDRLLLLNDIDLIWTPEEAVKKELIDEILV